MLPTNYLGLAPSKCQYFVELMDTVFPHTSQSSPHPKDVSSSFSNRAELWLLIFATASNVGFELHSVSEWCLYSFVVECHGIPKAFVWDPRCILYPRYHLQWQAVKMNYSLPVVWKTTWSDIWPIKTNGLCHWDMFLLTTSQVWCGKMVGYSEGLNENKELQHHFHSLIM